MISRPARRWGLGWHGLRWVRGWMWFLYYYVVHTNALISPHYLRGAAAISEWSRRDIGDPRGRLQQKQRAFHFHHCYGASGQAEEEPARMPGRIGGGESGRGRGGTHGHPYPTIPHHHPALPPIHGTWPKCSEWGRSTLIWDPDCNWMWHCSRNSP